MDEDDTAQYLALGPQQLIASLSRWRPQEEIGWACSQSLPWRLHTVKSRALSISEVTCSATTLKSLNMVILSPAQWILSRPSCGQETPSIVVQTSREDATCVSEAFLHVVHSTFYRLKESKSALKKFAIEYRIDGNAWFDPDLFVVNAKQSITNLLINRRQYKAKLILSCMMYRRLI